MFVQRSRFRAAPQVHAQCSRDVMWTVQKADLLRSAAERTAPHFRVLSSSGRIVKAKFEERCLNVMPNSVKLPTYEAYRQPPPRHLIGLATSGSMEVPSGAGSRTLASRCKGALEAGLLSCTDLPWISTSPKDSIFWGCWA